ncbi:MAG: hypothetical protein EOP49_14460 [Sphingobacteriales bacterium]|nr:MAG: hypothetical protein EOP49_14460 [Sphingobacteriales bacterium]
MVLISPFYRICTLALLLLVATGASGQQFPGMSGRYPPGISMVTQNPAWINTANGHTEIHLFSASGMAGTNAFAFSKDWFDAGMGPANEDIDYQKNFRTRKNRHIWGNIDVLGPAVSIPLRNRQQAGIYTRMRQVVRGGNIDGGGSMLIGGIDSRQQFPDTFSFEDAGFSTHVFGEIGLTYGRVLSDDYYHKMKAGVTVKYLMGMSAGSLYTPSTEVRMNTPDSLNGVSGDITALYSTNIAPFADNDFNNDISSWFDKAGGGGIGFDIGIQYEFHPNGNPNGETEYLYRLSAAITDIGSIAYKTDTSAGIFAFNVNNARYDVINRRPEEGFAQYTSRLERDSLVLRKDSLESFRMGLPTALRLQGDALIAPNFYVGANILLNLKGNSGDAYKPAYVNMLNFTPRFENRWLMIGVPFTFWGYQTLSTGLALRLGPLYLGSNALFSHLISKQIKNLDGYVGLAVRL